MQIIFRWFGDGFQSDDYHSMLDYGKEFERFMERSTLEYVLNLHPQSDFALHQDHYVMDDDDDEDVEVTVYRPGTAPTSP